MRRTVWLLLFALIAAAFPGWAKDAAKDAAKDDDFPSDSTFGSPSARTAIGQLGAVRIVVYDPVSNSFAFVIPLSDENMSQEEIRNRQYMDSRRLALTTQKIRLLILPYNPIDGSLTLQNSRSQGIEFAETPVASLPKAPAAAPAAASAPGKAPIPKLPPAVAQKTMSGARFTSSLASSQTKELDNAIESWRSKLVGINTDMQRLQLNSDCVHAHVQEIPINISKNLSSRGFSLAKDVSLSAVIKESKARIKSVKNDAYEGCLGTKQSLDQDAMSLGDDFLKVSTKVNALNSPYRVNGPEIPSTLDLTTIQEKKFRTAFYAGIVLNSDSFTNFFGQQK